jgi:dTDP-4-amino-4,6-dideoxygalactose transaminase
MDPADMERKITPRTKVIMPVHIFGQPADMASIRRIAASHGIQVLEDACQAVGSECGGQKTGSIGDIGCFSFFPTKNLGAFGDGGLITTNDDRLATLCRAYLQHGAGQNGAKARYYLDGTPDELAGTAEPSGLYNPYKYFNYVTGYNSRLDSLQAAILSVKLPHLLQFNRLRLRIADMYTSGLAANALLKAPSVLEGVTPVWHQYALRCAEKERLMRHLSDRGIGCAPFYPVPLHLQKALDTLGYKPGDFPAAEALSKQTVCLPIFPEMTDDEIHYVVEALHSFSKANG